MNIARALTIDHTQSVSESELRLLALFASERKLIIEVGSFRGRSTRAMADNTDGKIFCVDPWNGLIEFKGNKVEVNGGELDFKEFQRNLSDHIQSGKVEYTVAKFTETFFNFSPDMVFIDAIHEYEALKADIKHAAVRMKNKGLLCGHDYASYWPEVAQIVDEMFPHRMVKDTIWYVEL